MNEQHQYMLTTAEVALIELALKGAIEGIESVIDSISENHSKEVAELVEKQLEILTQLRQLHKSFTQE